MSQVLTPRGRGRYLGPSPADNSAKLAMWTEKLDKASAFSEMCLTPGWRMLEGDIRAAIDDAEKRLMAVGASRDPTDVHGWRVRLDLLRWLLSFPTDAATVMEEARRNIAELEGT